LGERNDCHSRQHVKILRKRISAGKDVTLINNIEFSQSVFTVQDGLRRGNSIPASNQDVPIEVHFSGRDDHQNGENCGDEAL
jgi:hypothetical protein